MQFLEAVHAWVGWVWEQDFTHSCQYSVLLGQYLLPISFSSPARMPLYTASFTIETGGQRGHVLWILANQQAAW